MIWGHTLTRVVEVGGVKHLGNCKGSLIRIELQQPEDSDICKFPQPGPRSLTLVSNTGPMYLRFIPSPQSPSLVPPSLSVLVHWTSTNFKMFTL